MKILVINGPNLNMLGIREPNIYGDKTYKDLCVKIKSYAKEKGIKVSFFQSNCEGDLVTAIQKTYKKNLVLRIRDIRNTILFSRQTLTNKHRIKIQ